LRTKHLTFARRQFLFHAALESVEALWVCCAASAIVSTRGQPEWV